MTATGVPQSVWLARDVQELTRIAENVLLKAQLASQHAEVMTQLPNIVADVVQERIRENFTVNGGAVSKLDIQKWMDDCLEKVMDKITSSSATPSLSNPQSAVAESLQPVRNVVEYRWFNWGGRMRGVPLPSIFRFPKTNVKAICDLMMYGVISLDIRPFRLLTTVDFERADQQLYSRAEMVFKTICRYAILFNYYNDLPSIYALSITLWDELFRDVYPLILYEIENKKQRSVGKPGEISYVTMYDLMKQFLFEDV